jgi:hypothetical protein
MKFSRWASQFEHQLAHAEMTAGPSIPSNASPPLPSKHSTNVPSAFMPVYLMELHGAKDSILTVSFVAGEHEVKRRKKTAIKRFI